MDWISVRNTSHCFCLSDIFVSSGTCRTPLGIQSGAIPDSAFQASSSLDVSLGPHTARIRSTIEGGGWCPKTLINSQSEEYLQINFSNLTVITLIETQGRFGPFQVR